MSRATAIPKRWEVWTVQVELRQQLVVVLSPEQYNARIERLLVCPVIQDANPYPFGVCVSGADHPLQYAVVDQITTLALSDLRGPAGWSVSEPASREVIAKLKAVLGLTSN